MRDNVVDFNKRTREPPPAPTEPPKPAVAQELFAREHKLFAEIRAILLKP